MTPRKNFDVVVRKATFLKTGDLYFEFLNFQNNFVDENHSMEVHGAEINRLNLLLNLYYYNWRVNTTI